MRIMFFWDMKLHHWLVIRSVIVMQHHTSKDRILSHITARTSKLKCQVCAVSCSWNLWPASSWQQYPLRFPYFPLPLPTPSSYFLLPYHLTQSAACDLASHSELMSLSCYPNLWVGFSNLDGVLALVLSSVEFASVFCHLPFNFMATPCKYCIFR